MLVGGGASMTRPPNAGSWLPCDPPPAVEARLLKRGGVLRICNLLVSLFIINRRPSIHLEYHAACSWMLGFQSMPVRGRCGPSFRTYRRTESTS